MIGPVILRDPKVRRQVEAHIQQLIDMLDQIDGDVDLEDTHDAEDEPLEPYLADSGSDTEWDDADTGIADMGGLIEQWGGSVTVGH